VIEPSASFADAVEQLSPLGHDARMLLLRYWAYGERRTLWSPLDSWPWRPYGEDVRAVRQYTTNHNI
jgi:hypothetical protein